MAVRYQYQALRGDEIRLAELLPGQGGEDLYIDIHHESLFIPLSSQEDRRTPKAEVQNTLPDGWRVFKTPEDRYFFVDLSDPQNPTYQHPDPHYPLEAYSVGEARPNGHLDFTALSYCWADKKFSGVAFIRNRDASADTLAAFRPLKIGSNLAAALRHLRRCDSTRTLWVDAICINQDDVIERGLQVKRMSQIYRTAACVVVWLGQATTDSRLAFQTLQHVGEQVEISAERWIFGAPGAKEKDWWRVNLEAEINAEQYYAIAQLLKRPWFWRVWVVQEIALAKPQAVMRCGDEELPFYYFRRGLAAFYGRYGAPQHLGPAMMREMAVVCYGTADMTTDKLLQNMRMRECFDARDKIYGALSLFGSGIARDIVPSYEKSVAEVYRNMFLSYSRETQRLDLLSDCKLEFAVPDLPTWVPDWRRPSPYVVRGQTGSRATGNSSAVPRCIDGSILEVVGVHSGTVKRSLSPVESSELAVRLREMHGWDLNSKADPAHESHRRNIAWIVSMGNFQERLPGSRFPALTSSRAFMEKVMAYGYYDDSISDDDRRLYGEQMEGALCQRNCIETDTGRIGVGPGQVGDRVYCLLGYWSPLLLRPVADGKFRVVGDCVVAGLMDGEAILGPSQLPWTVQLHLIDGDFRTKHVNLENGMMMQEDPRLPALSEQWERVEVEHTADDPMFVDHFRDRITGQTQNWDPRLAPDVLRARGVQLETVRLV